MEGQGHIPNVIPPFDGNNYAYWSKRTEYYLTYLGVDICLSVVNGYQVPKTTPIDSDEKILMRCNAKSMHFILGKLTTTISSKAMSYNTTKEVQNKVEKYL